MSILRSAYEGATKFYNDLYDHQKPKVAVTYTAATLAIGASVYGVASYGIDTLTNAFDGKSDYSCVVETTTTMGQRQSETIRDNHY